MVDREMQDVVMVHAVATVWLMEAAMTLCWKIRTVVLTCSGISPIKDQSAVGSPRAAHFVWLPYSLL